MVCARLKGIIYSKRNLLETFDHKQNLWFHFVVLFLECHPWTIHLIDFEQEIEVQSILPKFLPVVVNVHNFQIFFMESIQNIQNLLSTKFFIVHIKAILLS